MAAWKSPMAGRGRTWGPLGAPPIGAGRRREGRGCRRNATVDHVAFKRAGAPSDKSFSRGTTTARAVAHFAGHARAGSDDAWRAYRRTMAWRGTRAARRRRGAAPTCAQRSASSTQSCWAARSGRCCCSAGSSDGRKAPILLSGPPYAAPLPAGGRARRAATAFSPTAGRMGSRHGSRRADRPVRFVRVPLPHGRVARACVGPANRRCVARHPAGSQACPRRENGGLRPDRESARPGSRLPGTC